MSLFQSSVLNKYLKDQDVSLVNEAYSRFKDYFHNPTIQQNIRESKEEQFQEGFLRELFVNVLGYVINPNPDYNLTTEFKNQTGAKKADGAVLKDGVAIGVIELKSTKTKDLEAVRQQAFDYKANQTDCTYVVTSNFEKLRFYINNAVEYEEFDLFRLTFERFRILHLCLSDQEILKDIPLHIKEESVLKDEQITKKLYADYSVFKRELYDDLITRNMDDPLFEGQDEKEIKKTLFQKSQKLLDRFLFIFFAEDRGLLPPNSTTRILTQWTQLKDLDAYVPLYDRFKKYFGYLNTGFKGKEHDIYAYNGGLFKPDEILDSLLIDDDMLFRHTSGLTRYNFETEVDVNILGHIFENSLNEIETVNAEIEGVAFEKQTSKRKKDGVFYTPKYITKYIVDNTVGRLCQEKKEELGIAEEDYLKSRKGRKKETLKVLDDKLKTYRDWLLQITICDPACGSGAFLNQALNFLIEEHHYIDQLSSALLDLPMVFRNVENSILENNIFGVDLNEESVDIARLSLWLRTAQKGRKLTTLSENIKCGNSLIDDPEVAGDKAFNWQMEFSQIFTQKEKMTHHLTWVTHNSRTSQRMIDNKVKKGDAFLLDNENEVVISKAIAGIVKEDDLNVMAYNICIDHVHMLLVCEDKEVPNIVRKLKGKSSQMLKEQLQIPKEEQFTLWAQKYSNTHIDNVDQLWNTVEYIKTNREKHELPTNKGLQPLVDSIGCDYDHAFRTEYKGGFDVVIGNPPYVQSHALDERTKGYIYQNYSTAEYQVNTYGIFIEKIFDLIKDEMQFSVIIPNYWLSTQYDSRLRTEVFSQNHCTEILNVFSVFEDATVDTVILTVKKTLKSIFPKATNVIAVNRNLENIELRLSAIDNRSWSFNMIETFENMSSPISISFDHKLELKGIYSIGEFVSGYQGMKPYEKGKGTPVQTREMMNEKIYHSETKLDDTFFPLIGARNVQRFNLREPTGFIKYGKNLAAPRKQEIFEGNRLILNRILSKSRIDLTLVNPTIINNTDVFNFIPKDGKSKYLKTILAILASKMCSTFFKKSNVNLDRKAFPKLNVNHIENFPIPEINEKINSNFIGIIDRVLKLNKEYANLNRKFSKFFQFNFKLEKLTGKLQNWHELEFGEFISELNKAIKKADREKLSKSDEMDWMEVFETKKSEAQALKSEIDKTDKEIDQMVYELYGLTEEEIKVVEDS